MVSLVLKTRSPIAIKRGTHGEQLAEKQWSPALPRGTAGPVAVDRHPPNGNHAAVSLGRTVSSGREGAKVAKATHHPIRPSSQHVVGDELALNGGSNVVRVTLPLSSLVAMGVPVYPEMSDRRVTADVMMDPFGAVVAVRFVEARPAAD
jgi:hypothetical protein